MVDMATAQYLQDNVSDVLAKALAEMAVAQPSDGVGFLAEWLKVYVEQEEVKIKREGEELLLAQDRAEARAKEEAHAAKVKARQEELKAIEDAYAELMAYMESGGEWQDHMWQQFISVAKSITGASAVYLGVVEVDGENEILCYEHASAGSEALLKQTLPKDKGMTWGALRENPDEEAFQAARLWKPPSVKPVPAEGEEGDPAESTGMSYYPVNIDCVTSVPEMHYFEMTRLGAFLALPLVYQSYHTGEALAGAKVHIEEQKAQAQRRAEAEAAAAEQEGAEPLPPEEEKPLVLPGKVLKKVLCLDTLGKNTTFQESKILQALDLCKCVGQCKSQTEIKEVLRQAAYQGDEELRTQQAAEVAQKREEAFGLLAEEHSNAEAALSSQEGNLEPDFAKIRAKHSFHMARHAAQAIKQLVFELASYSWFPDDVLGVIAAAGLLCGYSKELMFHDLRKSELKWSKIKLILNDSLFEALGSAELEGHRKGLSPEHKISFISSLAFPPEMVNDDPAVGLGFEAVNKKAQAVHPGFEVLLAVVQAGVNYRKADRACHKAKYEERKQLASEEGQPFDEPSLSEVCDDFEEA